MDHPAVGSVAAPPDQVTVAASRDDTLPLLTGVRMEIEGEVITLLATDRYRLAMRTVHWNPASPDHSSVALVRARTLSDAAKSLGSADQVTVALSTGAGVDLIGFEATMTLDEMLDELIPWIKDALDKNLL